MNKFFRIRRPGWAMALVPILVILAGGLLLQRAAGQGGYTLTASPSAVAPGGSVTASWTAPSGRPTTDWIGLYAVGAPNTSYISWGYTNGTTSGSLPFTAPSQAGQYEFRYLLSNGFTVATISNPVTVSVPGFALTASPSAVAPGGSITASWTAPSGRPTTDWIGLYAVGAPNTSYISWGYTNGTTSGSLPFTAPSQAGQYQFRYLLNDGYTVAAISNIVTVTAP